MLHRRQNTEQLLKAEERRQREHDAGKLIGRIPKLVSLRLEIDDTLGDSAINSVRHIRHVVVDRAPALFEIPCTDHECRDGGHDLTFPILQALRASAREFHGEDACSGQVGSSGCRRVLRYVAYASYRDAANHGE